MDLKKNRAKGFQHFERERRKACCSYHFLMTAGFIECKFVFELYQQEKVVQLIFKKINSIIDHVWGVLLMFTQVINYDNA